MKKQLCENCKENPCICGDVPEELKAEVKEQCKTINKKKKLTKEELKNNLEEANKINDKLEKFCKAFEKKTWEKIAIAYVTSNWDNAFKSWVSASSNVNEIDAMFMGNKLAHDILDIVVPKKS